MAQTYVSVRLPEDLHAVLKAVADNEDRTLISTLRMLLSQHLSSQPNVLKPKAIEQPAVPLPPLTVSEVRQAKQREIEEEEYDPLKPSGEWLGDLE